MLWQLLVMDEAPPRELELILFAPAQLLIVPLSVPCDLYH